MPIDDQPASDDPYIALVDPELREAALMMRANTQQFTPMNKRKLAMRRRMTEAMTQPPLPAPAYAEHRAMRPDGGEVAFLVVNARPGAQGPGILHIHGGGYTNSSALGSLPLIQTLALELDCPVVTVEYRLAPETIWSGSLEDNYAALLWMHAHAAEIGVDPARIAVMGESAGGGHAALLTLAVRDRGEVSLAFQALIYPMIDDRAGTSRQLAEHIGWFGWSPELNRFGWQSFLGCKPGGRKVPVEAVPARVADLSGLPPAFIGVGGLDLFVEEDVEYARRLNAAGVPTELLVMPGAFHGFDMFIPDAAISRRFTEAKVAALRRGLGMG
ncbi:MAG: alpha/beta hydrolase [Novosphingobium sp.]